MPKSSPISGPQTPIISGGARDRTASITGPQPVDVSIIFKRCVIFKNSTFMSKFNLNKYLFY